jgi:hypothetical protein
MRRSKLTFLYLIINILLTGGMAVAQSTPPVSAEGHIYAEVISVFTASETAQMNFGRFSPGPQGGEIILTPENTVSVLGSVFKGAGSANAASFYVTGDANATYSITLPPDPVKLKHISDAKTLEVKDWVSIPSPGTGTGRLQNGYQEVYVGATLKIGNLNDNPVGIYTGSYTITFDFN